MTSRPDERCVRSEPNVRKIRKYEYEVTPATEMDRHCGVFRDRFAPAMRGDEAVGVRLVVVHPKGHLWRFGLRSGDVVLQVNGMELKSPEAALDAYSRLRDAKLIVLSVKRGGRVIDLRYSITP